VILAERHWRTGWNSGAWAGVGSAWKVGTGTGIRTPVPWLRIGGCDVDDDGAC